MGVTGSRSSSATKSTEKEIMDDADFIERCEIRIWDILYEMHRKGVRYQILQQLFQDISKDLELKALAETLWLE